MLGQGRVIRGKRLIESGVLYRWKGSLIPEGVCIFEARLQCTIPDARLIGCGQDDIGDAVEGLAHGFGKVGKGIRAYRTRAEELASVRDVSIVSDL